MASILDCINFLPSLVLLQRGKEGLVNSHYGLALLKAKPCWASVNWKCAKWVCKGVMSGKEAQY